MGVLEVMKPWLDGPPVTTDLFTHTLGARQISDSARFLAPQWPDDLHDPFLLPDMKEAVTLLWQAIETNRPITIMGDYDMDGTPAAALVAQFLSLFALRPQVILPTRAEGYGFQPFFVDRIPTGSLVLTVDCGIRDHEGVLKAKEKGCSVIITDHHECGLDLPMAGAVINPKRSDSAYPFRELSGTGVAYKVLQAMIALAPANAVARIPDGWLAWVLDLVCLATIADMVPLVDENRVLAVYGLKVLRKTPRLGLARFIEALGLDRENITYTDIAFKLIPKLNASGRMERMDEVFTLLVATAPAEIDAALTTILTRATQSQLILQTMMEEAEVLIADQQGASVAVVAKEDWHPGLTGIVAGRLVDKLNVPVAVLAGTAEGYRGSMRTFGGVVLPTLLAQAQDHLQRYGGHAQAAGLSLAKESLIPFRTALQAIPVVADSVVTVTDGLLVPKQIDVATVSPLARLAPWGIGHREPVWSLKAMQLGNVRWLSEGKHLKATLPDTNVDVIYFNAKLDRSWLAGCLDIYGTVAINEFRGNKQPQLMIKGVFPSHG